MDGSPTWYERAKKCAERERRERRGGDHPDPRGDLEWERTQRQERDDLPGHVVVDEGIGRLCAERHGGGNVAIRIPGVDADEDGRRSGPDPREVVEVNHLEPPIERTEEHDEENAHEDRRRICEIGASLGGHEVEAMLELG